MSDVALKETLDELRTAFKAEFAKRDEAVKAEVEKFGQASAESATALKRVQDGMDELEAKFTKLQHAAEQAAKSGTAGVDEKRAAASKSLNEFVRKSMIVGDDTTGGYLAPAEFIADIIEAEVELSDIRPYANVRTTSRGSVEQPKRTGTVSAAWGGETHAWTESQGSFGLESIPNHELSALVVISNWDIEDPEMDLEAYLRGEMAEQFAVAEGAAFIVGTGVMQPQGILSHDDVELIPSLSATSVTTDGVLDLKYALKSAYAKNARFLLNRTTIRELRKLKDANDQYLWQPGLATAAPATIDGDPYTEVPDMPTIAASAKVMAYGDFKRAYTIVDRIEMQMLRDPFTSLGYVKISARRRVGGQVVLPEAIKIMDVAAS